MIHGTQSTNEPKAARSRGADALVLMAMGVVACAIATGLHLQVEIPLMRAIIAGCLIYAVLLGLHYFVLGASAQGRTLESDDALWEVLQERKRGKIPRRSRAPEAGRPLASGAYGKSRPRPPRVVVTPAGSTELVAEQEDDATPIGRSGQGNAPETGHTEARFSRLDRERVQALKDLETTSAGSVRPREDVAASEAPARSVADYWSYRPSEPTHIKVPQSFETKGPQVPEGREDPRAALPTSAGRAPGAAPLPLAVPSGETLSPRESDVEMVQSMIKKLAEDVNAAELMAVGANSNDTRDKDGTPSIEAALGTLRATAGAMGNGPRQAKPNAGQQGEPNPPGPPPVTARHRYTTELVDALHAGRLSVLLEPILGLDDHRTRHYEVSVQVQSAAAAVLHAENGETEFCNTGLLPLFDRERVARAQAVVLTLEERGKPGFVFSDTCAESLTDREFCFNLAASGISNEMFARRLVLTFAQPAARSFTPAQWQTLHEMRELGFRFAMSRVTDLDMDFERLTAAGFTFVKIHADAFRDGLPAAGGSVPGQDICKFLADLGISLVVEGIDDETSLARIFGFGVLLGQGQLFGGARTIRADVLKATGHAAA